MDDIYCSHLACTGRANQDVCGAEEALPLPRSHLRIRNCCAAGRLPAYFSAAVGDIDNPTSGTDGINVLCAWCSPGYSQVNGRCIRCDDVRWGVLCGLLMAYLVLVWVIHRVPHDFSGAATLQIVGYFVQQSGLLLASLSIAQLASITNLSLESLFSVRGSNARDVDGEALESYWLGVCVAPLSDYGRLGLLLSSPLIAMGLLGVLLCIQLTYKRLLHRRPSAEQGKLPLQIYRVLFVPTHLSTSPLDGSAGGLVSEVEQPPQLSHALLSPAERVLFVRSLVRLTLLSYSSVALACVSYFSFQDVSPYRRRLMDYSSIDVDSSQYHQLLVVVLLLMAGFVCGGPVALCIFLYRHQRSGRLSELKHEQLSSERDQLKPSFIQDAVILQLCAMCRSELWWYPAFMPLRRCVLALSLVMMPSSSVWSWVSMVNYLLLAVHLTLLPFERAEDNRLEAVCLASLGIQATVLSLSPPPVTSSLQLLILAVLVLGPVLLTGLTKAQRCWLHLATAMRLVSPQDASSLSAPLLEPFISDSQLGTARTGLAGSSNVEQSSRGELVAGRVDR